MNKIIGYKIKNCPAYNKTESIGIGTCLDKFELKCKDVSDCLIKQIVELCKKPFKNFDLDDTKYQEKRLYAHLLLMPILTKLDIEEVE